LSEQKNDALTKWKEFLAPHRLGFLFPSVAIIFPEWSLEFDLNPFVPLHVVLTSGWIASFVWKVVHSCQRISLGNNTWMDKDCFGNARVLPKGNYRDGCL
jgi:hypothetical protein